MLDRFEMFLYNLLERYTWEETDVVISMIGTCMGMLVALIIILYCMG